MSNTSFRPLVASRVRHLRRAWVACGFALLASAELCAAAEPGNRFDQIRHARAERCERMMHWILNPPPGTKLGEFPDMVDLQRAMASFWLGERVDEGNQSIRKAYAKALGKAKAMTPDLAMEQKPQNMRLWLRIYFLFGDKGPASASGSGHPSRLDAQSQKQMLELFWNFASKFSTVHRAQLGNIWWIQGSENHDMRELGNTFLATQALKDAPAYKDRKFPDGHTPQEHYEAWNAYYKLYALERAKHGLFVEISPTYGKYFLPELLNIADLAEDPQLRNRMHMLVDVAFADWAIDQLKGIRGGGLTRAYQGPSTIKGQRNSWNEMLAIFLDTAGNWDKDPGRIYAQNYAMLLGTSAYQVPDVILDLALDDAGRGEYVYTSLRPAQMIKKIPNPTHIDREKVIYVMNGPDPHILRYSYDTPDYILGGFMLDPSVDYAEINQQNRWSGIIFATGPDARVFPECKGTHEGKTLNQHLSVQHENVMIVQKNKSAEWAADLRIWFSPGLKAKVRDEKGWLFVKEGAAYLAVGVLSHAGAVSPQGYAWEDNNWLHCQDPFGPLVFVAGRQNKFATLDDFVKYVRSHKLESESGVLKYSFTDAHNKPCTLKMNLEKQANLPQIDGQPINLKPQRVFNSPYLFSDNGSGVVTLHKGARTRTLDFNATTIKDQRE